MNTLNRLIILAFSVLLISIMITSPAAAKEIKLKGKNVTDYIPVLKKTKQRFPSFDPQTKLHVSEVKKNLFFVTDGVYQSAFLKTGKGVVVFDAPPVYGGKLPSIIKRYASDEKISHLIYSHGHKDHIGAAKVFKNIKNLKVVAHKKVLDSLKKRKNPDIILPNTTFEDEFTLTVGRESIQFRSIKNFHSTDADTLIYLPRNKFLIAIDTISPGYAPFKEFEVTPDLEAYISILDIILAYDFDRILTGHLGILGERADIEQASAYVQDVEKAAAQAIESTSLEKVFDVVYAALKENKNSDIAYRYYLETLTDKCSKQIVANWKDSLSGVDVWSDGHCDRMLMYQLMH